MDKTSNIFSVVLPVLGALILVCGLTGPQDGWGSNILISFAVYLLLSIAGIGCGFYSLAHHGFSKTAIIGLRAMHAALYLHSLHDQYQQPVA